MESDIIKLSIFLSTKNHGKILFVVITKCYISDRNQHQQDRITSITTKTCDLHDMLDKCSMENVKAESIIA